MINGIGKALQRHITKSATNNNYAAKTLIYSAAGLTLASNVADAIELGKNKKLKEEERKYVSLFQLTTGVLSAAAQVGVGLALINEKTQGFIRNGLGKISPKIAETLKTSVAKKNVMKISSLIAAVMITKRVIVPFITTPIASMVKKKVNHVAHDDRTVENIYEKGRYKVDCDDDHYDD